MLLSEHLDEVVDDDVVEVLSSQVGVSVVGQHLEQTRVNGQQGHIEGTASQIVDDDVLLAVLAAESVGDSRGYTHTFQQNALSIQLRWLCCTQFTACRHIKGQLYATVVGVCAFEFDFEFEFEFEFFARRTAMRGR